MKRPISPGGSALLLLLRPFTGRGSAFLLLLPLWLVAAAGCGGGSRQASSPRLGRAAITILHWNDFHAQNSPMTLKDSSGNAHRVGGSALLTGLIRKMTGGRHDVALLNAGDDFQGTPISSLTSGRSQIELMNLIGPDAMTLGNHEFDYGMESLAVNIARARFPIVCANVVDIRTGRPLGLPCLAKDVGGVRLGIIGAAPPDLPLLTLAGNLNGYRIRDIDSSIDLSIAELRRNHGHIECIVLLSHMGLGADTQLAARRRDIDVIVGGHDHIPLFSPIRKNRTVVVQAGSKGEYLGALDLVVDRDGDSLVRYDGRLLETREGAAAPDPAVAARVAAYESVVDSQFGAVIGTLAEPWDRQGGGKVEMNIGNFESDAMRAATATDIAFHNVGGIRKDLDAGPIRIRDIWEINPFGNTLVTFTVSGSTLKRMVEFQAGVRAREFVQVSGLRYVYDSSAPDGKRTISISAGGKGIVDTASYSICTNNYIGSHLREVFGIDPRSVRLTDTGLVDRDVIIAFVRQQGVVHSAVEGRIVDRAEPGSRKGN